MLRGGFTVLALAVLAVGLVFVFRDGGAPADRQPAAKSQQRDDDLASYGAPIKAPRAALVTARAFITAAVLRKDTARAWHLAAPKLRAGSTRREWLAGTMPVQPAPAAVFRKIAFRVVRARERDVLLLANSEYFIELVPSGRLWLVSYWAPRGHTGPIPAVP